MDKTDFIALLERFGYARTTTPSQLSGMYYLEAEHSDGGCCILLGDGGSCPSTKTVKASGYSCSPGCCCQFCFDPSEKFVGHCCCTSCPTKIKAV